MYTLEARAIAAARPRKPTRRSPRLARTWSRRQRSPLRGGAAREAWRHDEACRAHELTLQRINLERSHLLGSIRERFRGLDLRRVVGDYHARPMPDDDQRRRVEELTQLIDRMGPVNLDARAEHETAEKRFHELNDQKVDIEKALEELELAIRHITRNRGACSARRSTR